MLKTGPSGALSPYYWKGGYFHAIHYGSYFDDMETLRDMMSQEENFIMKSPERRRIIMDIYENNLTEQMILEFVSHIERMAPRIIKLAVAGEKKYLKSISKLLYKSNVINRGQLYFGADMDEGKTWLVSER
jgi:hypothetical protein